MKASRATKAEVPVAEVPVAGCRLIVRKVVSLAARYGLGLKTV